MFRQGLFLLSLCGTYSQQGFFGHGLAPKPVSPAVKSSIQAKSDDSRDLFEDQVCKSSSTICYQNNIYLCVDQQPVSESTLVHKCLHGCTPCADGPHLCNDEEGRDRCKANADRYVTSCDTEQQGTSFCSGGDVRYCNSSNLATLVEYCDSRGCQSDPLSCQPMAHPTRVLLAAKAKAKGAKGKKGKVAPTPAGGNDNCKNRTRVEWASMPDKDRQKYIQGVVALYKNGDMQKFAQLHYDNRDKIHGSGILHFLIWHRVFLTDFEEKIRAMPGFECVTVPFWTYDYSEQPSDRRSLFGTVDSKLGQADHSGCLGGPFASVTHTLNGSSPVCVQRTPTADMLAPLSGATFTDLAQLSEPSFATFSDNIQNAHGLPHVALGGLFATHFSPIDPAFFVHHCNIDRLFSLWQDCHNYYQWPEPQGLSTPIIAYPGVTAGNFIDLTKFVWQGKNQSVYYSSDALGDPTQYSSDFRRRIATACQGGQLSRSGSAAPVLGVDSWASTSGSATPQTKDVTLKCSSDTGTSDSSRLPLNALSVYDNLSLQDCVSRCGQFYFKNSGASNCICTTAGNGGKTQAASLSTQVNKYVASCGSGSNYGLFSGSGSSGSRRLLQMGGSMGTMGGSSAMGGSPAMGGAATPMGQNMGSTTSMGGPSTGSTTPMGTQSQQQSQTMQQPQQQQQRPQQQNMGGTSGSNRAPTSGSNAMGGNNMNMMGRSNRPTHSPTHSQNQQGQNQQGQNGGQQNLNQTIANVINQVNSTFNSKNGTNVANNLDSAINATRSNNSTMGNTTNSAMNNTATHSNSTMANNTMANSTHANSTSANNTLSNSTQTNSTNSNSTNSSRVCINAFAPPAGQAAAVACSSKANTPPPLPSAWIAMNNLKPESADTCKSFKPSNATKSFDCVQNHQ